MPHGAEGGGSYWNALYGRTIASLTREIRGMERQLERLAAERYLRLAQRGGKNAKKRAVVAVARKRATLLHRLCVSGAVYQPLRAAA